MATQEAGSPSVSEVDKLPSKEDMAGMSHSQLYLLRSKLTEQKAVDLVAPYEHRAFSREYVAENPVSGTIGMIGAIPGYQVAKAAGMTGSDEQKTGPSLEQMKQGAIGVGEGVIKAAQKPWEMMWNGLRTAFAPEKAPDRGAAQANLKPWEMKWKSVDQGKPSDGKFDMQTYLTTLDRVESGGNPNAASLTSSAVGPYQFTKATWIENVNDLGLNYTLSDRTDPEKARVVAEAFTNKQVAKATNDLGRAPSKAETYMYHLLGSAKEFLTAKPDTPAIETVSKKAVKANKSLFLNEDGSSKTVSEVFNRFKSKFGEK